MTRIPLHQQYAEGLRYFKGEGELNNVLSRLCSDLDRHEIDYMIIGAVAASPLFSWEELKKR